MLKRKNEKWLLGLSLVPMATCLLVLFKIQLTGHLQYWIAGINLISVTVALLGSGWQVLGRHQKGSCLVSLLISGVFALISTASALAGMASTLL